MALLLFSNAHRLSCVCCGGCAKLSVLLMVPPRPAPQGVDGGMDGAATLDDEHIDRFLLAQHVTSYIRKRQHAPKLPAIERRLQQQYSVSAFSCTPSRKQARQFVAPVSNFCDRLIVALTVNDGV